MKGFLAIGADCWVCGGPCRYGQCPDCGGHSEHNWGCVRLPASHGGPVDSPDSLIANDDGETS